jgi:hypothetical protein
MTDKAQRKITSVSHQSHSDQKKVAAYSEEHAEHLVNVDKA